MPDKTTGTGQKKPYIRIYGKYESDKSKETIELKVEGKTNEKIKILKLAALF